MNQKNTQDYKNSLKDAGKLTTPDSQRAQGGTLVVQWLRLCAVNAGAWVPSLIQELYSTYATTKD